MAEDAGPWSAAVMAETDIFERIRFARDKALEAERTERQRLKDADTAELQSAASVRLATRQAVREAFDDILDESTDPGKP